MKNFKERKQERTKHFEKYVKGWKEVYCVACMGSGRYDDNGSPKCGGCDGTGKEKVSPKQYEWRKEKNMVKVSYK